MHDEKRKLSGIHLILSIHRSAYIYIHTLQQGLLGPQKSPLFLHGTLMHLYFLHL